MGSKRRAYRVVVDHKEGLHPFGKGAHLRGGSNVYGNGIVAVGIVTAFKIREEEFQPFGHLIVAGVPYLAAQSAEYLAERCAGANGIAVGSDVHYDKGLFRADYPIRALREGQSGEISHSRRPPPCLLLLLYRLP